MPLLLLLSPQHSQQSYFKIFDYLHLFSLPYTHCYLISALKNPLHFLCSKSLLTYYMLNPDNILHVVLTAQY